jgi:hypothetical protein
MPATSMQRAEDASGLEWVGKAVDVAGSIAGQVLKLAQSVSVVNSPSASTWAGVQLTHLALLRDPQCFQDNAKIVFGELLEVVNSSGSVVAQITGAAL